MVLDRQGTMGAVLERSADTYTEPEVSEERGLGTLRSSLTVIRNPSLEGYLGILMADRTAPHGDDKSFHNASM